MDLAFAFSVIFTGIVIVFLVLVVLIAIMEIMGRVLGSVPKAPSGGSSSGSGSQKAAAPAPAPAAPAIKKMEVEDGIGDEIVAVIAAAIAALTGGAAKPVAIRRAKSERAAGRSAWSLAGLQENTQPF